MEQSKFLIIKDSLITTADWWFHWFWQIYFYSPNITNHRCSVGGGAYSMTLRETDRREVPAVRVEGQHSGYVMM